METLQQLSPVPDELSSNLALLDLWEAGQFQPSPDTLVTLVTLQRKLIEQEASAAKSLAGPAITHTVELISA